MRPLGLSFQKSSVHFVLCSFENLGLKCHNGSEWVLSSFEDPALISVPKWERRGFSLLVCLFACFLIVQQLKIWPGAPLKSGPRGLLPGLTCVQCLHRNEHTHQKQRRELQFVQVGTSRLICMTLRFSPAAPSKANKSCGYLSSLKIGPLYL